MTFTQVIKHVLRVGMLRSKHRPKVNLTKDIKMKYILRSIVVAAMTFVIAAWIRCIIEIRRLNA